MVSDSDLPGRDLVQCFAEDDDDSGSAKHVQTSDMGSQPKWLRARVSGGFSGSLFIFPHHRDYSFFWVVYEGAFVFWKLHTHVPAKRAHGPGVCFMVQVIRWQVPSHIPPRRRTKRVPP